MSTVLKDLVSVHIENKPAFYARIEEISPDIKPGWWQVKLLVLTHPLQIFTWILEESQINGAQFTMGGTPVFLEKVVSPVKEDVREGSAEAKEATGGGERKETAKVVSMLDRKKEK
jgi:hypothetical protein